MKKENVWKKENEWIFKRTVIAISVVLIIAGCITNNFLVHESIDWLTVTDTDAEFSDLGYKITPGAIIASPSIIIKFENLTDFKNKIAELKPDEIFRVRVSYDNYEYYVFNSDYSRAWKYNYHISSFNAQMTPLIMGFDYVIIISTLFVGWLAWVMSRPT